MFTRNVQSLSCDSMSSCQDSNIILSDPAPNFGLYCNGMIVSEKHKFMILIMYKLKDNHRVREQIL